MREHARLALYMVYGRTSSTFATLVPRANDSQMWASRFRGHRRPRRQLLHCCKNGGEAERGWAQMRAFMKIKPSVQRSINSVLARGVI